MTPKEVLYHFSMESGDIKERLARYVDLYPDAARDLIALALDELTRRDQTDPESEARKRRPDQEPR